MPRHLFHVELHCPHSGCTGLLTNAGVHQKLRQVLDLDTFYCMAGEYLLCSASQKKVISWSEGILNQLDNTMRSRFPCILTAQYACDLRVVRLMRQRSLGNSSSAVRKQVLEEHGETYLLNLQRYLSNYKDFKTSAEKGFIVIPPFTEPPPQAPIPGHRWFMLVYQLDVLQRLDYIKACITSVYGTVLKMDSTKKVTNKLAGRARKTAMWATNIGNEYGQVLMSVLTAGEGSGLKAMIDGLVRRYRNANVSPPLALYVDRDCCGSSSIQKYFQAWPFLNIRLDIWHFMRRFPYGCSTEQHQLYSVFMGKLSQCIFRWDESDLQLLQQAKRAEMIQQGIQQPSNTDVMRRLSSNELALHCKRVTRGVNDTVSLISSLLESFYGSKGCDTLGVPLFDSEKMRQIWSVQSKHVVCIQDPPGVHLYTQVSTVKKGGVVLPVYRCARGSTSLESFHLHLNRFIPGTLARDINFQVFLLDGVFRWNCDREIAAVDSISPEKLTPKTYSGPLKNSVNKLAEDIIGRAVFENFKPPGKYSGELIGIEYLYSQTGEGSTNYELAAKELADDKVEDSADVAGDEGFVEPEFSDLTIPPVTDLQEMKGADVQETSTKQTRKLVIPTDEEYRQMLTDSGPGSPASPDSLSLSRPDEEKQMEETSLDDTVGPDNIPGYGSVLELADFLVTLREQSVMTLAQVQKLKILWQSLSAYDKKRSVFPQRFSKTPLQGRFKSPKKMVVPGVETIERAILGPNQVPAQWPDCNRYVEATVERLLQVYLSDRRIEGKVITRWSLVLGAYHRIRQTILNNHSAMAETEIQLPLLNKKTLQQWFNKKSKQQDKRVLVQGLNLPTPSITISKAPEALPKPSVLPSGTSTLFQFHEPHSTVGMARLKKRPCKPSATASMVPILPVSCLV